MKETLRIVTLKEAFTLNGFSQRRRVKFFRKKGTDCVSCGCVGAFFALEMDKSGGISIDLYGIDTNGVERLMTIDHVIPKSKGGSSNIDNLQPMCERCNQKKGDKIMASTIKPINL
jgi:hypothetical protein